MNTSAADKPHSPPASQGKTPLHLAAKGGHTETAKALMAIRADVNAKNVSERGRQWAGEPLVKPRAAASDAGRGCGICHGLGRQRGKRLEKGRACGGVVAQEIFHC